jgi:hypothetical protein
VSRARVGAVVAISLSALGCCPAVFPVSSAPFGREGSIAGVIDLTGDRVIHLSKGVALALECRDKWEWSACDAMSVTSASPGIARVLPAHLDKYRSPYGMTEWQDADISHRAAFVVMGV